METSGNLAELRPERGDWLRLQTLVLLRWLAIGGQVVAIGVATWVYEIALPLGPSFLAVGAAIAANLALMMVYPTNKRLNETEALVALLFDLAQLSILLFLTGGFQTPLPC